MYIDIRNTTFEQLSVGFHSAGSAPFGTTAELNPVSKDGEASTSSVKHGMGIELVCPTQGKYHDDGFCLCCLRVYKCILCRSKKCPQRVDIIKIQHIRKKSFLKIANPSLI